MSKKTPLSKRLTIQQIDQRYPREWILLSDVEIGDDDEVIAGKVVFHSMDRDEMYREAIKQKGREEIAFHYTGTIPEGTAIILWASASIPS